MPTRHYIGCVCAVWNLDRERNVKSKGRGIPVIEVNSKQLFGLLYPFPLTTFLFSSPPFPFPFLSYFSSLPFPSHFSSHLPFPHPPSLNPFFPSRPLPPPPYHVFFLFLSLPFFFPFLSHFPFPHPPYLNPFFSPLPTSLTPQHSPIPLLSTPSLPPSLPHPTVNQSISNILIVLYHNSILFCFFPFQLNALVFIMALFISLRKHSKKRRRRHHHHHENEPANLK